MGRRNARNSGVLKEAKERTSPGVYDILLKIVNEDREDLAEVVLKIDYLFEYASSCLKQRDKREAEKAMEMAKKRMDKIRSELEGADIEYLDYLYNGIMAKIKKHK